ncbi:MAG: zf-TFIIB domain-containing protein [Sedimentisphaerales bacterium]|nr:zf-TFIIB domain-containing protein [Sedimentisphaerales bacterium]
MECPACGNGMEEITVGDVKVDVCRGGCGGVWFDQFELKKFDEPHESAGQELLNVDRDESVTVDRTKQLTCPRCGDFKMLRHFFSVKREVEVDECPNCGGYWLDAGELRQIRSQFATEEERSQAAKEYFRETFGEELAAMEAADGAKAARAGKIASLFRFICPSYYIPGEQSWGAF